MTSSSSEGCTEIGCGCLVLFVLLAGVLAMLWIFKRVWEWL